MTSNRRPAAKRVALRIGTMPLVVQKKRTAIVAYPWGQFKFRRHAVWHIVCVVRRASA